MPGIFGLLTRMPRKRAESELLRMLAVLRHENFYVTGTWCDESLGVYVGWVARKDSFSDGMPLRNERGDVVLVFSGEEFPGPNRAQRHRERGYSPDVSGPSYLVHLYEEDSSFPAGLNGRFHGLLIDRTRGTTTLFNDRYGMQRIYYHESKEAFYFAAEAKAILEVCPETKRLNTRGMAEFITCGSVLENRTIFDRVKVLPGASAWVFRNGSLEKERAYFDHREWEDQALLDPESYYQEIKNVFSRNLPRYFSGQQRIGMSLTGGLDSRMILAWQKPSPGKLPCYTFGGMYRNCRDVIVARQVARACGQPHEVITVGREFLSQFSRYAERTVYLTDGCADVSRSPDLYVNERAREIAPVRMTGNYGGEVLRRVVAFKPIQTLLRLYQPEFDSYIPQVQETYTNLLQEHPLSFAVFRQAPWHHYGLLALEQTQISLRSPYLDNDFVKTVFRAPESATASSDVCFRLVKEGNLALSRIPTDRGLGGSHGRLASAASHSFFEFMRRAEYAYDYGMPQWLAQIDRALSPLHFERLFLGRHKFYHFRIWYRDALSRYVKEILLDPRTLSRPYVQRNKLEEVVQGHTNGNRNYTSQIHHLLTLELLHRLVLDRS